jgi:hypothetical protein
VGNKFVRMNRAGRRRFSPLHFLPQQLHLFPQSMKLSDKKKRPIMVKACTGHMLHSNKMGGPMDRPV